mgnify:CR=1 FL=1
MSIVIPSLHKPEKIAVVGANGSIGQRYAKILKNRFNKNPVLCDVKEGFSHPDEICHDFFELVLICTPSSSHLDVAKKFSQTKHFFIEKPLDTSIRKIKECGLYLQNKTFVSCKIFYSKHMRTIEKHIKNARVINISAVMERKLQRILLVSQISWRRRAKRCFHTFWFCRLPYAW